MERRPGYLDEGGQHNRWAAAAIASSRSAERASCVVTVDRIDGRVLARVKEDHAHEDRRLVTIFPDVGPLHVAESPFFARTPIFFLALRA